MVLDVWERMKLAGKDSSWVLPLVMMMKEAKSRDEEKAAREKSEKEMARLDAYLTGFRSGRDSAQTPPYAESERKLFEEFKEAHAEAIFLVFRQACPYLKKGETEARAFYNCRHPENKFIVAKFKDLPNCAYSGCPIYP